LPKRNKFAVVKTFLVKQFFAILGILMSVCVYGENVHIFGNSKDYKGNELIFYKYSDRITFIKEQVFTLKIDKDGNFDTNFNLEEITYVFAEFGVYHAYFYAEPGAYYELILPEYDEKDEKDIFNPFFSPEEVHIGIKDLKQTDLNYLIIDFDYYYFRYLDLNYLDIYSGGLSSDVDTFINNINFHYKDIDNQYFNDYKNYRIAALKNIATQKQYEKALVYAYYTKSPVLYDNPAYMDLFNNIYADYFDEYLTGKNGATLYAIINYGHSINRLKKLLNQNFELKGPQFRELVILKGLNDAFANKNLPWLPLLLTLDSVYLATKYPIHQKIAQNIADNSLSMARGTIAPPFELPDSAGNIKELYDFRGKYVYLGFANTKTYTSQIEFGLIKNLYERYRGTCIFITVLTDEDKEGAMKFIRENELKWQFLFTDVNSKTISSYNVVTYPTYFLIDTDGTLLMSPAPSPCDNFETYFFKLVGGNNEGRFGNQIHDK